MSEKLVIIKTLAELSSLIEYIKDKDYVAYDTETTGVKRGDHIIGFSVCADIEVGYYVCLAYWDTTTQKLVWRETKEQTKAFLEVLKTRPLVMQNSPFDCSMTKENFGVELMQSVVHDTMIGGHLLNENRYNGLKERGVELFGEDANLEQRLMKESVHKNGGVLTKDKYELYKGDEDLIAHYGAKDAILTLKVFYNDVPQLFEDNLDKFFYEEESMPLLKGPTYDMNTTGLRVDPDKLQKLKQTLEADCLEGLGFINKEVSAHVKAKYPGTGKTNHFNVGAGQQRAWLLYDKLNNPFHTLTKGGKALCKALNLKPPYTFSAKREFIQIVTDNKGKVWEESTFNKKTKKMGRPKKIQDPWTYMSCGRESLEKLQEKYKWVKKYLEYAKNLKLLNTYVEGIQSRMEYNIIRPSFLQHGTTSGRYSSKNPNFQNLPREDKRVKACIIARQGKVFVGADYSQLEPRVFASFSQDPSLMGCFSSGDDFYSVVGAPIFGKEGCSLRKDDKNSFAKLHPELRQLAKEEVALATVYGTTAFQMSRSTELPIERCQEIIDNYLQSFPGVEKLMLDAHEQVKTEGRTYSLFGRPRRQPEALKIKKVYGNSQHSDLPYNIRNMLNLAVNHRIQSTGASIMNRAAIAVWNECQRRGWTEVKIVLQVHDELILEGPEALGEEMAAVLKYCMENTTELPGVKLIAEPKIAYNLADLK
jgi:DNA polymerase I-like protein with 3'-5' exonuclease and polymerase domains